MRGCISGDTSLVQHGSQDSLGSRMLFLCVPFGAVQSPVFLLRTDQRLATMTPNPGISLSHLHYFFASVSTSLPSISFVFLTSFPYPLPLYIRPGTPSVRVRCGGTSHADLAARVGRVHKAAPRLPPLHPLQPDRPAAAAHASRHRHKESESNQP